MGYSPRGRKESDAQPPPPHTCSILYTRCGLFDYTESNDSVDMSFQPQNVLGIIFYRASFLNIFLKNSYKLHQKRIYIRSRCKLPSTEHLSPHSPGISGWHIFSLDIIGHSNSALTLETRDAPLWPWGLIPIVHPSRRGPSHPRESSSLYAGPCKCANHCFQMFHTLCSLFS